MDRPTETEIAAGLRQGDREAWLALYDLYADKVWRNVARLVGSDPASVADIVQETFLAAAHSAGNFNPRRGSLWVWLWTIGKRQVALHYRKCEQRSALVQAQMWWMSLDGQKDQWLQGDEKPPSEVLESRELAELVRSAIEELLAEYQVLPRQRYIGPHLLKRTIPTCVSRRKTLIRAESSAVVLLTAKYIDGAAIGQIADQAKGSRMAVRSKLARARKAFREAFARLTHRASG
ncbi:MAG TPA: sigma-70 family RNA polymerase sigma factor, partial [Sedimentisphaerales bacterium]|nr:sigma-70 family RNA polymerase sigma factor [Sedimentisphaerales bacterium]